MALALEETKVVDVSQSCLVGDVLYPGHAR